MDQNLNSFIFRLVDLCLQNPAWKVLTDEQKEVLSQNLENHFFQVAAESLSQQSQDELCLLEYQNINNGDTEIFAIELVRDCPLDVITSVEADLKQECFLIINQARINDRLN